MKRVVELWDFLFGMLVVGVLPMFAFVASLMLGSYIETLRVPEWSQRYLYALTLAVFYVSPLAVLFFAIRWRRNHRILPVSYLAVEAVVGLVFAAVIFLATLLFLSMAALN